MPKTKRGPSAGMAEEPQKNITQPKSTTKCGSVDFESVEVCTAFLKNHFDGVDDGWLTVNHSIPGEPKPIFKTDFFSVSQIEKAVTRSLTLSRKYCTWYSTNPRAKKLSRGKRGGVADVSHMLCVSIEIDFASPHRKTKTNYPSPDDKQKIIEIIKSMPYGFSIIVDSGYGLHVYLYFSEPYEIENDADCARATRVLKGWQRLLAKMIRDAGFGEIDGHFDLDKLLRLPGTFNRKGDPRLVSIVERNDNRVGFDELESILDDAGVLRDEKITPRHDDGDIIYKEAPHKLIKALAAADKSFGRLMEMKGKRGKDQSFSAYLETTLIQAGRAGWSRQNLYDLGVHYCTVHGQVDRITQAGWIGRSVQHGLAAGEDARDERERDQSTKNLSTAIRNPSSIDVASLLADISTTLGIPVRGIRRPVVRGPRLRTESSTIIFTVEGDDGVDVDVECSPAQMMTTRLVCAQMWSIAGRSISFRIKPADWGDMLRAIGLAAEREVADIGLSPAYQIGVFLREYLEKRHRVEGDPRDVCSRTENHGKLAVCDGYEWWTIQNFQIWLKVSTSNPRVSQGVLGGWLSDLGCVAHTYDDGPRTMGKRRTIRVWRAPDDLHEIVG